MQQSLHLTSLLERNGLAGKQQGFITDIFPAPMSRGVVSCRFKSSRSQAVYPECSNTIRAPASDVTAATSAVKDCLLLLSSIFSRICLIFSW